MEARTLVYQEVMVGYFKWVQMRGFKQGHIWSCPPQRGDNFIFWCHPPHQRTPSRDRLNAWYNSILLRSSKLGVLEEVGTLWSACFSGYGRRELSGRKDKVGEEQKSSEVAVSNETPSAEEVFSVNLSPAVSTSAAPSSSCGRQRKSDSTTAAGGEPEDAPVCPPVFEGDFWVTECLRVHRLMMARSKGCDGQDRGVNQRKCRDLLKDLMSKPLSLPFCRPVDTVKLGIPDYLIVVTQPMDLGTIRDLLRTRYYKSILHFAEVISLFCTHLSLNALFCQEHFSLPPFISQSNCTDISTLLHNFLTMQNVRLTFSNALKYNPIGHPINESARLLSVEFESCLVELLSEYIGAVPKAENVDKYLDTYPIADIATPVPQPSSDLVDRFESKSGSASRVPPLKLPLGDGSAAKGWSMQSPNGMLESVLEEGEGDSIIGDQTPCNRTLWDVSGTPRLRRADSMDSIQSYGSAANENSNMGEDWTPRVLFTSAAVSGPLPQSPMEGPDSERKPFEKPALGFKGAMALMSEIAKSVFRLKDDLFVIKFSTIMTRPDKAMKKRPTVGHSSNRTFGEGLSNPDCEEDKADSEDEAYPSPIPPICRSSDMTSLKDTPNVGQPGQCDVADDSNPSLGIIAMEDIKDNHVDGLTNGHSIDGEKIVADSSAQSVTEAMPNHFGVLPSLPSGSIDSITASSSSNSVAVEQADLVAIVPVTVRVAPPSAAGRRGRDANRNRKTHQKKGKTPRGKSRGKAKSSSESVSSTGAITAATMANRAKGGKAGAYLRRLDQSDRGEGDFEEELSDRCLDLLTNLVPDTSDPDPLVKCAFVDSRHTFLEMCQFRHYQFDSLRRAKHSSLMLLYHLHFPDNTNARPTCACCNGPIRDVRWHCDQCTDFDMCDACYYAGEAEVQVVISTLNLSTAKKCKYQASESDLGPTSATPSISHSHSTGKKGKEDFVKKEEHTPPPPQPLPLPVKSKKHLHTLTPFRITYI